MNTHTSAQTQAAPAATPTLAPLTPALTPARPGLLQRKCACGGTPGVDGECAECRAKRLGLQRQAASPSAPAAAPPIVHEVLRSPGQSLDAATRAFMEPRFGHDFSRVRVLSAAPASTQAQLTMGQPGDRYEQEADQTAHAVMQRATPSITGRGLEANPALDFSQVRVHTDSRAAESARAVNALAYTVGQDVVFGAGQYAPGTPEGRRLLAHELTHVVQQGSGQHLMRLSDQEDDGGGAGDGGDAGADNNSGVILPGTIEVSPESSVEMFGSLPNQAAPENSTPDEALVTRKASSEGSVSNSPEQEALSEAPYPTGMNPGQISTHLQHGHKLDTGIRASMEARYGHSLDHVRIHTDQPATSLCERFAAQAFAFGNHIVFSKGSYAPKTPAGEQLLRHEVAHVLQAPTRQPGIFRTPAICPTTCAPGTAPAFVPVSDTTFNCYSYAMNNSGSGFLQPGGRAGTAEFVAQRTTRADPAATPAALTAILSYFSPAGVKRNAVADLGAAFSSNCSGCCPSTQRKIISVTTDAATKFKMVTSGGAFVGWAPMVSPTQGWDHHWYRKDADRSWSHKRGQLDAQQDDAAGTSPICNPCTASRAYAGLNYNHVVGSWCVS